MLKNQAYLLYLIASVISSIGTGMHFIAITWLILEMTDSTTKVGITLAISFLPLMFLASFGGIIADRYDRRIVMVVFNLFRFLSISLVPVVYWVGDLSIFFIYFMQFLNSIGTSFYMPANSAFIREIIHDDQMYRANATTQVWIQLGKLSGAGLGGVFIAWFGSINVVFMNAITFLVAAMLIFFARKGYVSPQSEKGPKRKFWVNLKEGTSLLFKQKGLFFYVFLTLLPSFFVHIYNLGVGVFVKVELNEGADALGIIDGAYAVGALVLGLFISKQADWLKNKKIIPMVVMMMGLPFLMFSLSSSVAAAAISVFLLGAAFQVAFTMFNTLIQITPPKEFVGRISGFAKSLQSLLAFAGLLYFGGWLEESSVRTLLLGIFLLLVCIGVFVWGKDLLLVRKFRDTEKKSA
ncbi:MFS family permease [Bacillus pakistanensis]|uniref:MFS family permease n=1 Tax=Rossellomorea pakistanensis TaxID=992288 RepID=A0ABS2NGY7_9BACI|nr:MFS transporter [Bacillus pakistanensis]MBM7587130.1 MFS family permease [Bacillus pakistanensis]